MESRDIIHVVFNILQYRKKKKHSGGGEGAHLIYSENVRTVINVSTICLKLFISYRFCQRLKEARED